MIKCKHDEKENGRFCKQCLEEFNNADSVGRASILYDVAVEKRKSDIETQSNTGIIKYRFVVNDAVVYPWEPMEEAGTTLSSLVEYLKGCVGYDKLGSEWDYRRLRGCCGWNPHIIDYGLRSQFYIPVIPKDEEFYWLEKEHQIEVNCTCGNRIKLIESQDANWLCPDNGIKIHCRKCGANNIGIDGRLPRTYKQAVDEWNLRFGKNSIIK